MQRNTLYYGDCLDVMRKWSDECVDLIYLDPPFNSNANYNILFGTQKQTPGKVSSKKDLAQITAFSDTWEWDEKVAARISQIKRAMKHRARDAVLALDSFYQDGNGMLAYLVYMADRLNEMYRVLCNTDSIYLHCDPTASHYLKMIMDCIFGAENFRNEIIWCYPPTGRPPKNGFPRKHDSILFYSFRGATWHQPYGEMSAATKRAYSAIDAHGRCYSKAHGGRTYLDETRGRAVPSWWDDIGSGSHMPKKERLGYPTQKPMALLQRIIRASSNPHDVVLDPFCGCGTTVQSAMSLQRDFVGIDISKYALDVIQKERMRDVKFAIEGVPKDLAAAADMARSRPFAFEKWAVHLNAGFVSNNKQTGDGGIDGWAALLHAPEEENGICIAQVKGGSASADALRAFTSRLLGGNASVGIFITLKKLNTPTAQQCIADAGSFEVATKKFNRLVMWSVEEHFAGIEPRLPVLAHPRTGQAMQKDLIGNLL